MEEELTIPYCCHCNLIDWYTKIVQDKMVTIKLVMWPLRPAQFKFDFLKS